MTTRKPCSAMARGRRRVGAWIDLAAGIEYEARNRIAFGGAKDDPVVLFHSDALV